MTLTAPIWTLGDQGRQKETATWVEHLVYTAHSPGKRLEEGRAAGWPWSAEGPGAHPQRAPSVVGAEHAGPPHTALLGDTGKLSQAPAHGRSQHMLSISFIICKELLPTSESLPAPTAFWLLPFLIRLPPFTLSPSTATNNWGQSCPASLGDSGRSELSHFHLMGSTM